MSRVWPRRVGVAVAVLVAFGLVLLEGLRFAASRAGVEEVPLPPQSEIYARSAGNDYADAYRVPVGASFESLAPLLLPPAGAREVFKSPNERIMEGGAPGLRYLLSHRLRPGAEVSELTVSTVVFYETWLGPVYFTPVKIGHRRLVPFYVARLAREAERRAAHESPK